MFGEPRPKIPCLVSRDQNPVFGGPKELNSRVWWTKRAKFPCLVSIVPKCPCLVSIVPKCPCLVHQGHQYPLLVHQGHQYPLWCTNEVKTRSFGAPMRSKPALLVHQRGQMPVFGSQWRHYGRDGCTLETLRPGWMYPGVENPCGMHQGTLWGVRVPVPKHGSGCTLHARHHPHTRRTARSMPRVPPDVLVG